MGSPKETATIRKISGKDEVRQHLAELGFVVDSDVTVVSEIGGNLIVTLADGQLVAPDVQLHGVTQGGHLTDENLSPAPASMWATGPVSPWRRRRAA